jgi:succinate dehydrogenase (ubiquinone) iron-sulfur subunit
LCFSFSLLVKNHFRLTKNIHKNPLKQTHKSVRLILNKQMPSAPLPGSAAQFASPLFMYKKILKRAVGKQPVCYTAKDNEKIAMHVRTGAAGFGQFTASRWYLKQKVNKENRNRLEGIYECVLCASCTGSCPMYWWAREEFLGPAVLLQSYRWLIEPLDRDFDSRVALYEHGNKVNMCHNIFNCSITCPKYLNPGFSCKEIKRVTNPLAPATQEAQQESGSR